MNSVIYLLEFSTSQFVLHSFALTSIFSHSADSFSVNIIGSQMQRCASSATSMQLEIRSNKTYENLGYIRINRLLIVNEIKRLDQELYKCKSVEDVLGLIKKIYSNLKEN